MSTSQTTLDLGGKSLELEIGRFAQQATSAVLARLGDTLVHATVVMSQPREDIDWFPLQVEYQEKLYAGGKIKGSRWVKRDGRPSDDVILKARIIDRSIRPLFPEGFKNEIQIVVTVLSADGQNDADIPAMFAVSTALALSPIPWDGPVGALRLGLSEEGEFLINPTYLEREASSLDLVVSGTKAAVVMVEAGANEVSEAKMLEAFKTGQEQIQAALVQLDTFIQAHAQPKISFTPVTLDPDLIDKVTQDTKTQIPELVKAWARLEPTGKDALVLDLYDNYGQEYSKKDISKVIDKLMKEEARRLTIKGNRPDGRKPEDIRDISSEVSILPRTHGSAVFQRGSTQALTITTLGSPSLYQLIESMETEEEKRYIHHYYMPPFSVGEAGRMGWPSRREVGHGALAERALEPMIPSEEEFPYAIHVVSEIMSSNGSTSMASVCGSTLSLMDAGVQIKRPVSGIAMGLIKSADDYIILSDIQGLEDHTGDMDFKVAGTTDGITAMQMDTKISGIPMPVLEKALEQARLGRLHILKEMLKPLPEPRPELSQYAPKITTITVPVDKIGEIIGPGGKIIKQIIKETGADIDINEEGHVFISSVDQQAMDQAKTWINDLIRDIKAGEEFTGEVVRIENYGAFVNLLPGRDGLLHVSNMSTEYVRDASQVVKLGEKIKVRVLDIGPDGKVSLTTLTPEEQTQKASRPRSEGFGSRDSRPPRRQGGPRR